MIVGDSQNVSPDNIFPSVHKPLGDNIFPPVDKTHGVESAAPLSEGSVPSGILSTPAVRHLAKQYGLNINEIVGTGKDGRVLKEDVLNYAVSKGHRKEQSLPLEEDIGQVEFQEEGKSLPDVHFFEDKKILLRYHKSFQGVNFSMVGHTHGHPAYNYKLSFPSCRGYQRSMVKSMSLAAKVPHFHYLEEINCDSLVQLKTRFQNENKDQTIKHTFLPFLIKSLSMALSKYPMLNSSFIEETNEVVFKGM